MPIACLAQGAPDGYIKPAPLGAHPHPAGGQKERAGFASGPEALGNGGVSSREDEGILTDRGKKTVNDLISA